MECNRGEEKKQQRSWTWLSLMAVVIISVIITAMVMLKVVKPRVLSVESTQRLESMCNVTMYPDQCYKTLLPVNSSEPKVLFRASLVKAMEEHVEILGNPWKLNSPDEAVDARFKVCEEMVIDSLEYLNETIERVDGFKKALGEVEIEEMREKLSYVIVDHETCLESFEELDFSSYKRNVGVIKNLRDSMQKGRELVSNSLAIVTKILGGLTKQGETSLLGSEERGFPHWFDQKSLLTCRPLTPNVTVAKDGTGDYLTIGEAVASIPEKSSSRFVIHVKAGVYMENVNVTKYKDNVFMYGDGKDNTVVSGSRNRKDSPNLATYQTATFSVSAKGFVVKDMKFENIAGPEKDQAVAFHSKSIHSVMYRCTFQGYQDTLYPQAGVQFYRECIIIGTVDFIFGAAAAVFQNCVILPRQPIREQVITVTAQSSTTDNHTKSSFSIINSQILPYGGAKLTARAYLGRPWRPFATVVVMKSLIGSFIDNQGWLPWDKTLDPPAPTLTYGEYKNYGPGSSVTNRVNWTGYKPRMTDQEALTYTVDALINQDGWLKQTCIPYNASF